MAVFKVDVCWDDAPTLTTAVERMLDEAQEIVKQLAYSCMPEPTLRSELPQLAAWAVEDQFRQVTWQAETPVEIGGERGPETWSYVRFEGPRDALEGLARIVAVWDASDGQPSDDDINFWISMILEDGDEDDPQRGPARYESLDCEGGVHKNCRDRRCYCDCHLDKDGGAAVETSR